MCRFLGVLHSSPQDFSDMALVNNGSHDESIILFHSRVTVGSSFEELAVSLFKLDNFVAWTTGRAGPRSGIKGCYKTGVDSVFIIRL